MIYSTCFIILGNGLEDPAAAASAKDIAVALVEGMFVLAEFSYWQVYNRYIHILVPVGGLFSCFCALYTFLAVFFVL